MANPNEISLEQFVGAAPQATRQEKPKELSLEEFTSGVASRPVAEPTVEERPGLLQTIGEAGRQGFVSGIKETVQGLPGQEWKFTPETKEPTYVETQLAKPISEGWRDPNWWAANMMYGLTKSSPTLASTVVGGAAGAASPVPGGAIIGSMVGAGVGSAIQSLAPAYQQARSEGLDHDAAVDRAIKDSGIASAFGSVMGATPFFRIVKGPISNALAQIFGAQPGLATLQHATTEATHGKEISLEDLAKTYAIGTATGAAQVGAGKGAGRVGRALRPEEAPAAAPEAPVSPEVAAGQELGLIYAKAQKDMTPADLTFLDYARRGGYGRELQERAGEFFTEQNQKILEAANRIENELGRGTEVAPARDVSVIPRDEIFAVADRLRQEASRAQEEARAAETQMRGLPERGAEQIAEQVRGAAPDVQTRIEAGDIVGPELRRSYEDRRRAESQAYRRAEEQGGGFYVDAINNLGTRIRERLSEPTPERAGMLLTERDAPIANQALNYLDYVGQLRMRNIADPRNILLGGGDTGQPVVFNLTGVEAVRRELNRLYGMAQTKRNRTGDEADFNAVRSIRRQFEEHLDDAFVNGMFSGNPEAISAWTEARGIAREVRQFFRRSAEHPEGQVIREIVERQPDAQAVANLIMGSGRIGRGEDAVLLSRRLSEILGPDSNSMSAIRQAAWNEVSLGSGVRRVDGTIDPRRMARNVLDFVGQNDRNATDLARELYTPEVRQAMRDHANAVRGLEETISRMPEMSRAETAEQRRAAALEPDIGGRARTVFDRIVDGTAQPEEIANLVATHYAHAPSPNLARMINHIKSLIGENSESMAAIRQLLFKNIVMTPDGATIKSPVMMDKALGDFLDGRGSSVARASMSPQDMIQLRKLRDGIKPYILPEEAKTGSPTEIRQSGRRFEEGDIEARRRIEAITRMLSHGVVRHVPGVKFFAGPIVNKITESAGSYTKTRSQKKLENEYMARLREQIEEGFERSPLPEVYRPPASGLATEKEDDRKRRATGGSVLDNMAEARAEGGRTDDANMRQPELRSHDPKTLREALPAALGKVWENIPGVSSLDPNVERRGMDVGHRLTKILEQSPAGLALLAQETGAKTGEHLTEGQYLKALGTLLGGGAGLLAPFGIRKAFGPGNKDVNIAKTLEEMAPGKSVLDKMNPNAPGLRGSSDFNAPSSGLRAANEANGGAVEARANGGSTYVNWTANNSTWQQLSPYQKAAAMALMEADRRDPESAKNALGAMINRAARSRQDLGSHVSQRIYQPTIEPSQQARLPSILKSEQFKDLAGWAERRAQGQEPDPVHGATHFITKDPRTMLKLEASDPSKYSSWRGWTGYTNEAGDYKDVLKRDASHAFLAPEGRFSAPYHGEGGGEGYRPPSAQDQATLDRLIADTTQRGAMDDLVRRTTQEQPQQTQQPIPETDKANLAKMIQGFQKQPEMVPLPPIQPVQLGSPTPIAPVTPYDVPRADGGGVLNRFKKKADGGKVDFTSPEAQEGVLSALQPRSIRGEQAELRAHEPVWYDKLTNYLTDKIYGENATAKDREMVSKFVGPENPYNVPAQVTEGYHKASEGLTSGDLSKVAMGALGMAGGVPGVSAAAKRGIRAYHGSPHEFEKFDISKIGTGEGNQTFGHGLYFAENEAVARNYRDALSRGAPTRYGKTYKGTDNEVSNTAASLMNIYKDVDQAVAQAEGIAKFGKNDPFYLDVAKELKDGSWGYKKGGHMYEVNIKANPDHFLDWDKPLSQQGAGVTERLREILRPSDRMPKEWIEHSPGVEKRMREVGIPGIRYLDQGSRGSGKGTYNYVVFDPNIIEIMRRYGIAGTAVGGGLLFTQDELQAAGIMQPPAKKADGGPATDGPYGDEEFKWPEQAKPQSGWDRDIILPFARKVEDGQVVKGGGILGSDWHFATPQAAYDALNTALHVGTSSVLAPFKRDPETREKMIEMAGSVVGPQAGVGMARVASGSTGLGSHGGKLPTPKAGPSLDPLGYYSQALEAAKAIPQAKGTPEQMLAQLKKAGVKDSEIAATGLNDYLSGKTAVTKDDLINHLNENRVALTEVQSEFNANTGDPWRTMALQTQQRLNAARDELSNLESGRMSGLTNRGRINELRNEIIPDLRRQVQEIDQASIGLRRTNWERYSLDPNNPTYQETVLHLPEVGASFDPKKLQIQRDGSFADIVYNGKTIARDVDALDRSDAFLREIGQREVERANTFRSGHFSEPNIVGHLMTSMNKHEGKPVFTLDQIQSDWGQKIREKGSVNEQKLQQLKTNLAETEIVRDKLFENNWNEIKKLMWWEDRDVKPTKNAKKHVQMLLPNSLGFKKLPEPLVEAVNEYKRLSAEIKKAEANVSTHPLVNTTDQWTNTVLRRALTQAIDEGADYIAIPHGDTVLKYNPGDQAGMRGFYGSRDNEGIVPKNLRNILKKIDPEAAQPMLVNKLETPTIKNAGQGFTLFPITDKVREAVTSGGLPLFQTGIGAQPVNPYEDKSVLSRFRKDRQP